MQYKIRYQEDALHDLGNLPRSTTALILDEINVQLSAEPTVATSRRKQIISKTGEVFWQLRVGDHRVWYFVAQRTVHVWAVVTKGRKTTEEILEVIRRRLEE